MGTIAATNSNSNNNLPFDHIQTIGDVVSHRHCPVFFENDPVKIILPLLEESGTGAAGVVDMEGALTGLLTERDILRHVFARSATGRGAGGRLLDTLSVGDVMTSGPETLQEDMTIEDAAAFMLRRGRHVMPVVSRYDARCLVGIVSEHELSGCLQERLKAARKSERAHKSILSYMLREPYGAGYVAEES